MAPGMLFLAFEFAVESTCVLVVSAGDEIGRVDVLGVRLRAAFICEELGRCTRSASLVDVCLDAGGKRAPMAGRSTSD
eukprot:2877234-Rhodomonas_salina.1